MEESTSTTTFAGTVESLSADPKPFGSREQSDGGIAFDGCTRIGATISRGSSQGAPFCCCYWLAAFIVLLAAKAAVAPSLGFCLLYCAWITIFLYARSLSALVARGERVTKLILKMRGIALCFCLSALSRAHRFSEWPSHEPLASEASRFHPRRWREPLRRAIASLRISGITTREPRSVMMSLIFKSKDTFFVKRVIAVGGDTISGQWMDSILSERADIGRTIRRAPRLPYTNFFVGCVWPNHSAAETDSSLWATTVTSALDSRYPSFGLGQRRRVPSWAKPYTSSATVQPPRQEDSMTSNGISKG